MPPFPSTLREGERGLALSVFDCPFTHNSAGSSVT